MYCPVTAFVGHALDDNAFESPLLTSAERVFAVRNRPPVQCTALRWKKEWLKRPVFRKVDNTGVSPDEAVPYHIINEDLQNQSLDDGNETPLTGRAWRRWRANNMNNGTSDAWPRWTWTCVLTERRRCARCRAGPGDATRSPLDHLLRRLSQQGRTVGRREFRSRSAARGQAD